MGLFSKKPKYEVKGGGKVWRLTENGKEIAVSRKKMTSAQAKKWGTTRGGKPASVAQPARAEPAPRAQSVNDRAKRLGM